MGLLSGWREWCIAILSILDCLVSLSFFPFLFVVEYIISIAFRYFMPLLLLLHYSLDGFRWQLYPLYLQLICILLSSAYIPETLSSDSLSNASPLTEILSPTLLSTAVGILNLESEEATSRFASTRSSTTPGFSILNISAIAISLRVLSFFKVPFACISLFLCWLFPFPSFSEPDGNWGCGVEEFQFVASVAHQQLRTPDEIPQSPTSDTSRPPRSPLITPRTFQALVFYPIEKHRHKSEGRYRWLPLGHRSTTGLSRMMGLPRVLFEYLLRLETQSVILAPLSKKRRKYPIVFLSHGLGMMKTSQSLLCQVSN